MRDSLSFELGRLSAFVRTRMRLAIAIMSIVTASPVAATDAAAHVIMGTKSLHLRVVEADLVAHVRILDPQALFVSADGHSKRQLVEVQILEILKGKSGAQKLLVAQDGHEVAAYSVGHQALFFLEPIERSRELRALAVPGGPTHVSSQEHDERFLTDGPQGEVLLSATRALVASESAATSEARVALIRRATLELLTSGDTQLATSALASLVLAPHAALLTPADVPRLEKLLADSAISIGLRAGLLAELERRGLVEGPGRWLAILQNARPAELARAIRAASTHPSEPVTAFLLDLLESPGGTPEIKAEAAVALGASRNPAVVGALVEALENGEPRLRNGAIRGLGQIGGDEARQALERASRTHRDPGTRNRAQAEIRSVEARSARSDRTSSSSPNRGGR